MSREFTDLLLSAWSRDVDMRYVPKLYDYLWMRLEFSYLKDDGAHTRRTVIVRKVFGNTTDQPLYIRGWCMLRDEIRTFSVERICEIILPSGGIARDNIPYFINSYISIAQGKGIVRAPIRLTKHLPIVVELNENGTTNVYSGELRELLLEYRSYGPRAYLTFKPDSPRNGSRRWIKIDMLNEATGYDMLTAASIACGSSGEIIEDVYSWAARHLGRDEHGWPLPEASGDK